VTLQIESPRLTIVPLDPRLMRLRLDDYGALQKALCVEPLSEPHYGDAAYDKRVHESLEAVTEHLERSATGYLWYTFWQIISKEHNSIIGEFNFHGPPNDNGEIQVGYVVRRAHRMCGYATEGVGTMATWVSQQRGVTALVADTGTDNTASRRVLEKSGAQLFQVKRDVLRWRIEAAVSD
jgi:ribosomal-protein-alanine N-acetyltransferase